MATRRGLENTDIYMSGDREAKKTLKKVISNHVDNKCVENM